MTKVSLDDQTTYPPKRLVIEAELPPRPGGAPTAIRHVVAGALSEEP
jgi:hypothetical protein